MNRSAFAALLALALTAGASAREEAHPVKEASLRAAAAKSIRLIQKSQVAFSKKAGCVSCHHQILPALLLREAHDRGVAFDPRVARDVTARTFAYLKDLDAIVQGQNYIDDTDEAWKLLAAHAAGVPQSLSTSAIAQFLARKQRPDGSWYTMDNRPPQSSSRVTTTAISARAVALYLPRSFVKERQAVLERARKWLLAERPRTTEERTFQLLGLLWTGAEEPTRKKAARALLGEQRKDGGWAQLPRLGSDAYSTGEALYALHQAGGLATSDPVYQAGLRFLLADQYEDGSWRVASRLHPPASVSPRYFTTGFPHGGRHQYSSLAGTNWATLALLQAVPAPARKKSGLPVVPTVAPDVEEWTRVALDGTAADLKKALDGEMKPNAKTAAGTTALMLAARDPAKVKLLLERGAEVNTRAKSGYTALIVAARFHGNTEAIRHLLKKGATVKTDKKVKVAHQATALFFATTTGDVKMVGALLDAGAAVNEQMLVLGAFLQTPLIAAALRGDGPTTELLIRQGADPNAEDEDKNTPLDAAAINNRTEAVKVLVARGAKVNHADNLGMTALHYAASLDSGDTLVVEQLLAAGADRKATEQKGRTALDLARTYRYAAMMKLLGGKPQSP